MLSLEKRRQLKLLILVFQNQRRKSLFCQKKLFLIVKFLWTRRKILFNILARPIDQYVAFTYKETMLRNALRKRSCRRFLRAVLDGLIKPSQIKFSLNFP